MMMTDEELREFEETNWARVPEADRERCVSRLRLLIFTTAESDEKRAQIREEWEMAISEPGFHLFTGVWVRNSLRRILEDDQLPDVDYPDGRSYQNWDDFYMAALREALA